MAAKPYVYLETTVISYRVANPSRDVVVAARQALTREWWDGRLAHHQPVVSPVVEQEIRDGDPEMAARRVAVVSHFSSLAADVRIDALISQVAARRILPEKALGDLAHLSFAAFHGVTLMVTWNFRHLANRRILWRLQREFGLQGYVLPDVFTPEQLLLGRGL
jgi:hypothetical protein